MLRTNLSMRRDVTLTGAFTTFPVLSSVTKWSFGRTFFLTPMNVFTQFLPSQPKCHTLSDHFLVSHISTETQSSITYCQVLPGCTLALRWQDAGHSKNILDSLFCISDAMTNDYLLPLQACCCYLLRIQRSGRGQTVKLWNAKRIKCWHLIWAETPGRSSEKERC